MLSEIRERLFSKGKNDFWEGSEGTVFALLKERLTFVAEECTRTERVVRAEYNKKEQWAELRIVDGDMLAIFTAQGSSTKLECVFVTPEHLTERERGLLKMTFNQTPIIFIR
jgi:hypothetical protein